MRNALCNQYFAVSVDKKAGYLPQEGMHFFFRKRLLLLAPFCDFPGQIMFSALQHMIKTTPIFLEIKAYFSNFPSVRMLGFGLNNGSIDSLGEALLGSFELEGNKVKALDDHWKAVFCEYDSFKQGDGGVQGLAERNCGHLVALHFLA